MKHIIVILRKSIIYQIIERKIFTQPNQLSPLTLAFMGDGIYELKVRDYIIRKYGSMPPSRLHFTSVNMVKASFQSCLYEEILHMLDEKETSILKRGRNAQSSSVPKNADPASYRRATGVEALFGYLYFCDQHDRLDQLFDVAINLFEQREV